MGAGIVVMSTPAVAAASSPAGAACAPGLPVEVAFYTPLQGDNRQFYVQFVVTGSDPDDISDLTVSIDGETFTGELDEEDSIEIESGVQGWEVSWDVEGTPESLTGPICGNFTVDGVTYRADFVPAEL